MGRWSPDCWHWSRPCSWVFAFMKRTQFLPKIPSVVWDVMSSPAFLSHLCSHQPFLARSSLEFFPLSLCPTEGPAACRHCLLTQPRRCLYLIPILYRIPVYHALTCFSLRYCMPLAASLAKRSSCRELRVEAVPCSRAKAGSVSRTRLLRRKSSRFP